MIQPDNPDLRNLELVLIVFMSLVMPLKLCAENIFFD
jgi:hypothetical protein